MHEQNALEARWVASNRPPVPAGECGQIMFEPVAMDLLNLHH